MNQPELIVIDDEADFGTLVSDIAELSGFRVTQYTNARLFKNQFDGQCNHCTDVIVLDLMMPDVDGIEIIRFLAEIRCKALLILMSGFDQGVLHSAKKLAIEQGLNFSGSFSKTERIKKLGELLSSLSITPQKRTPDRKLEVPPLEELKAALNNNELVVFYQPKVDLQNNSLLAVEALARWQHPVRGMIMPDLFIPLAEQHGLIDKLTWIVLDNVMTQCQTWLDQGQRVQVAVNMSANTLKELDLPEKMGKLVDRHGLDPSQIVLEITESALMQELIKSLDILIRLRIKGFRLSIDDFGTGYSSMVQLHRAPFSEIKVDRSFVADMEEDHEAESIVETIIMLGDKLQMKVVAEGVETRSCQAKLVNMGCDHAQGYLFSRPIPAEGVLDWFAQYLQQTKPQD